MALPTASDNQFPKVILEEVANDGSATVTPAADHRALFLGEDGGLHLKDSAAAVTDIGGATDHGALTGLSDDDHTQYILKSIVAAKGDILGASANDTPAITTVGTNGQRLKADSGQSSGLAWTNHDTAYQVIIDGGGSAITTGAKGFFRIPHAGTIVEAWILADVATTTTVDLWKDTVANHPATDADSITSASPLATGGGDSSVDTTLASWTTSVTAGDTIRVNVDSNNNATILNVGITVRRT